MDGRGNARIIKENVTAYLFIYFTAIDIFRTFSGVSGD